MIKITLAAARVNAGFTQKNAAKALGISNKTLGKWESGISFPDVNEIIAICELYKIPYDNLTFLPND